MDVPRDRGATLQGRTHVSHVDTLAGFNVSSLPILEKGEQFPRVICILALLCSHYKMSL
jgi:hypothetical protein